MYIIKVLKRKDAASVIVAIWLALALNQLTTMPVYKLAGKISGMGDSKYNSMYSYSGAGWRSEYLEPVVVFVLGLLILEVLIRVFVTVHPMVVRKRK